MAERKAVNKYYPPDWDPRKGSVNKRVGQHPLRDRARKLSQGILVIRFELPYNIWCGGCGNHVGMGVRYNAEKSKVGNYYSTPIYKFRMKCHLCDNYFEIQTDPKNHDYVILSGARRKEQRWDPVANEQVVPEDKATQKKLATDPMYKLEHGSDDQQKGKEKVMTLSQIEDSRLSMRDDYILNRMARDKFRGEKKQLKEAAEADRAILERCSLDIDLVEETEEDKKLADLMKYSVTSSFEDKQKEIRKKIEQRSLFGEEDKSISSGTTSVSSSDSSSSPSSVASSAQLQAALSLHRVGDSGKQLGKTLQASFKDPFISVRKKGKDSLVSFSLNRNKLGIRLLSADDMKSMTKSKSASGIAKGKVKNSEDLDAKQIISNVQPSVLTVESQKCSTRHLETSSNCDSSKSSPTLRNKSSPVTVRETFSDVKTQDNLEGDCDPQVEREQISTSQTPFFVSTSTQNLESHVIKDDRTNSFDGREDGALNPSMEESVSEDFVKSEHCDNRFLIRRHSGLQTLISSYTGSDSDSSS